MAEMTAAAMVEWLTADKAFGEECYSRKQVAALIEQLAATIESMKCCGNCLYDDDTRCPDDAKIINNQCSKWKAR